VRIDDPPHPHKTAPATQRRRRSRAQSAAATQAVEPASTPPPSREEVERKSRKPKATARREVASQMYFDSLSAPEIQTRPPPGNADPYEASPVKRRRATKDEMQERAEFLIDYASQHGPVTVRQLYYRAEVVGLPGIDKHDNSYVKVQRQVLALRRSGDMPYEHIADATRWMRKPDSYDSIEDALEQTARFYRKNLWQRNPHRVEIWLEKDALAGVIFPVTAKYDVPLMVTRGFSSETFCFEAVEAYDPDKQTYIYYLGDFDRAGVDAARTLEEKLKRFAEERGVFVRFETIAITPEQIERFNLPTREPKRVSAADKNWPHDFACELDAMEPDTLRDLVERVINAHLPQSELKILKVAEASEREFIRAWVRDRNGGGES
jgi:hypothetical protein